MFGKKQAFLDYDNIYFWMIAKLEFSEGVETHDFSLKNFKLFLFGQNGSREIVW